MRRTGKSHPQKTAPAIAILEGVCRGLLVIIGCMRAGGMVVSPPEKAEYVLGTKPDTCAKFASHISLASEEKLSDHACKRMGYARYELFISCVKVS